MSSDNNNDNNESMAFLQRVGSAMQAHTEILLAIMGDQHGFFKDLAQNGPGTSEELATRNYVNERYMREWLNGMVCAKYLSLDHSNNTYSLPPAHIPVLAQEYGPMFVGGMLGLLGSAESVLPRVFQCMKEGGGVSYGEYPPSTWSGLERHTGCNFENRLIPWISMMDPMVEEKLKKGVRVCDVGCGRGRALMKMAKQYPNSTFTGFEIMEHAVEDATRNAKAAGINNLSFVKIETKMDKLPSDELFDIIFVFDVIHDAADPLSLLRCLRSSLSPSGILECLDIKCSKEPEKNNVLTYGMSLMYCMTTSIAQKGVGLGTCGLTKEVMEQLCKESGFSGGVKLIDIQHPFNVIWEARP